MHESTGKYPYAKTFFFSADIDSKIAKGEKNLMVTVKICILNSDIQRCIIKYFICMNDINHVIWTQYNKIRNLVLCLLQCFYFELHGKR